MSITRHANQHLFSSGVPGRRVRCLLHIAIQVRSGKRQIANVARKLVLALRRVAAHKPESCASLRVGRIDTSKAIGNVRFNGLSVTVFAVVRRARSVLPVRQRGPAIPRRTRRKIAALQKPRRKRLQGPSGEHNYGDSDRFSFTDLTVPVTVVHVLVSGGDPS